MWRIEKSEIIAVLKSLQDVLIALPSSGPIQRLPLIQIIEVAGADIQTIELDGQPLSDLLMAYPHLCQTPTQAYKRDWRRKAMSHITGGGLIENIPRVLPANSQAVIDVASWTRPAIFDWLQEHGNVDEVEMHRVLNCGVGMVICVAADQQAAVLEHLQASGEQPWVIGHIQAAAEHAERIVLNNLKSHP